MASLSLLSGEKSDPAIILWIQTFIDDAGKGFGQIHADYHTCPSKVGGFDVEVVTFSLRTVGPVCVKQTYQSLLGLYSTLRILEEFSGNPNIDIFTTKALCTAMKKLSESSCSATCPRNKTALFTSKLKRDREATAILASAAWALCYECMNLFEKEGESTGRACIECIEGFPELFNDLCPQCQEGGGDSYIKRLRNIAWK